MFVKICGLTREEDIDVCVALGVDAIGLNLTRASVRRVDATRGQALAAYIALKARPVWVLDAEPPPELSALLLQFPRSLVQRCDAAWLWPEGLADERRMEVVRLTRNGDVERAAARPEPLLVCDAPGALGGTGKPADWSFARALAPRKSILLAGGLNAGNVGDAIRVVRPFGVDVASGVEASPGIKDHEQLRAFVRKARS
jgi:phosphoribosylanthranilate isomerase